MCIVIQNNTKNDGIVVEDGIVISFWVKNDHKYDAYPSMYTVKMLDTLFPGRNSVKESLTVYNISEIKKQVYKNWILSITA